MIFRKNIRQFPMLLSLNVNWTNVFIYEVFVTMHFQMGIINFNDDKLDEAASWFHRAIDISPNHTMSIKSLGTVYTKQASIGLHGNQSYANAILWSERYLALAPRDVDFIMELVTVYFRLGDSFENAMRWLDVAIAVGLFYQYDWR